LLSRATKANLLPCLSRPEASSFMGSAKNFTETRC
jgi:hypothetical protein